MCRTIKDSKYIDNPKTKYKKRGKLKPYRRVTNVKYCISIYNKELINF